VKADTQQAISLKVYLHPAVLRRLRGPDASLLTKLEKNYDLKVTFEGAESYHMENYKVLDESTQKEIR